MKLKKNQSSKKPRVEDLNYGNYDEFGRGEVVHNASEGILCTKRH